MRFHSLYLLLGIGMLCAQEDTTLPLQHKRSRWGLLSYQEVAYNHFLGAPDTLRGSVEGLGSIKINLSWLPHLRFGAFYAGIGAGLAIREVRFEDLVVLFRAGERRMGYTADSLPPNVRAKSKFQLGYIRLPVEIGIYRRKFNFAIYGYGEALLWAKHKRKYREGSDLHRFISYGNRNFQTDILQYGVGVRIGYKGIGIFANYNLSPLWSGGRGPANVHPLQAGIYFFQHGKLGKSISVRTSRTTATAF
ncbi:MAG: hypothetical protein N2253_06260 [Bacteroidia bacterium]|nr:hypothetical protein [Bacteroidia bacterium]